MNREIHVRFWESLGVRFPRATHCASDECAHGFVDTFREAGVFIGDAGTDK